MSRIHSFLLFSLLALALGNGIVQNGMSLLEYLNSKGGAEVVYAVKGISGDGRIVMKQSGTAEIQGECYHLSADGMEIFCDGESLYCYSPRSEELVISGNDALPMLEASVLGKNSAGNITASYRGTDGASYTVELKKVEPLKEKLPQSHFIFKGIDNPNLIVTDIR